MLAQDWARSETSFSWLLTPHTKIGEARDYAWSPSCDHPVMACGLSPLEGQWGALTHECDPIGPTRTFQTADA